MNGVYESAVLTALEEHPKLTEIVICTDNDEGGIDAADRLGFLFANKRPPTKTAIWLSHSLSRGCGCYTTPTVTAVEALYFTEI